MSKILFISFFFLISCSTPQSRVFPNNEFSRIEKVEEFRFAPDKIDRETGTSVLARVTLRKLIAKQIVSLSTVYFPPDNFRVDIFTTGLPKLLLLVARDSRAVQLVVPSEQAVYLGDAASRPLTRVIGFPLPELLLLNLLLGKSDLPEKLEFIEHSKRAIFRVEYREESGFRYRLYFKKIGCLEKDISAEKFKLTGLEVLSEQEEYLFIAKAKFDRNIRNCSDLFPTEVSFENFNNRFSGEIADIHVRNHLTFNQEETTRLFSPSFPGYLVHALSIEQVSD